MTDNPVANAAANLALLQYLTTPTNPVACLDCAGVEPEDLCGRHQQEYWADVLADRAEADRAEADRDQR